MRVLLTSMSGTGHVLPMVPLALGLQRAGHDVAWATAADAGPRLESYGLRAFAAGLSPPALTPRVTPAPTATDNATPPRERRALAFGKRFAAAAARMRPDLVRVVDDFRPELLVHDVAELATAPIATRRGIRHVSVAFSGTLSGALVRGIVAAVAELWSAEGLAVPSDAGIYEHLYLHRFPPAFGPAPDYTTVRTIRPVGFDGAAIETPPEWLADWGSERPAVYASLGTVVSAAAQWRELLMAFDSMDIDVIATVGSTMDPAALGPIPGNVRVAEYVPQSFVLDRVSAVVSHAGAGTMLAAAERGLPQLCIPMGADMWENADAVTRAGAAVTLEEDNRDAGAIRTAVDLLLQESVFTTAAAKVAQEIAVMPHPDECVRLLEALADS